MKVASLARDYFPSPPTPTNKALPLDDLKILKILRK
jgi:hypothetical protein